MIQEYAIEVNNVTKRFRVYNDKGKTLKEIVLFSKRRKYEEREVLKGINFNVKKGEAVGIIGHNGCGKSTVLKLLSKIMYSDTGTIKMNGRVSSLIELGAGFHPDMSGRENIYINASIFGLTHRAIDKRLNNIIEFSELEEYIDNPVRTYSSGMYMRLAFSVAINVDADILLVDEILAVGDANFQSKCFEKLRRLKDEGTTIVIVSHSLSQIEQICDRSLWIHEGIVKEDGKPRDVHPKYMDYMGSCRTSFNRDVRNSEVVIESKDKLGIEVWREGKKIRWGNGQARIIKAEMYNNEGKITDTCRTGDSLTIKVHYEVLERVDNAVLGLGVFRSDGLSCYGTNTMLERAEKFALDKDGCYSIKFRKLELLPGEYFIDLTIEKDIGIPVDYYTRVLHLNIYSEIEDIGVCRLDHIWLK